MSTPVPPTAPTNVGPGPAPVPAPDRAAREAAQERLAALATPAGALGRVGELAVWWAGVTGECPAGPPRAVRAVVLAGDHGVAQHGVSAYPSAVTPAMVRTIAAGTAGVSVLARQHDVHLRLLDIGVDDPLDDVDPAVRAHKLRHSSGAIHLEDALTSAETHEALRIGSVVADEEIAAGADLLITGDLGIGNTTASAALVAAGLGRAAVEVVGRGTGVDDDGLAHKTTVVQTALDRAGRRVDDPVQRLAALGSGDLAVTVGLMVQAARRGVPVLLDGLISVACALTADQLAPGARAWFLAGHRSPEPAQSLALEALGLEPVLDLGMRLGEGSGAVAAVPLVRSAALLLSDTALLSDVL